MTKTKENTKTMSRQLSAAYSAAKMLNSNDELERLIEMLNIYLEKRKASPSDWLRKDGPQPQTIEEKKIGRYKYYYLRFDWKGKRRSKYLKGYKSGDPRPFVTFAELEQWEKDKIRDKEKPSIP